MNGEVSPTKVMLSSSAKVSPKRSDRSSVAKSRSYTSVRNSNAAKNRMVYTLARGMTPRNETMGGLEGE